VIGIGFLAAAAALVFKSAHRVWECRAVHDLGLGDWLLLGVDRIGSASYREAPDQQPSFRVRFGRELEHVMVAPSIRAPAGCRVPETIGETEEQWCRAQRGERNERNGEMHKEMRSRDERWRWERSSDGREREREEAMRGEERGQFFIIKQLSGE
jgi:hypothetical protein